MTTFTYKPDGDVLKGFLKSEKFFRGIKGPVGSGKSVAGCVEILRRSLEQEPDKNGVRKTRWAVIRNTNPQLKTTTIKTWLDWFPENEWGKFNWSPPFTHHIVKPGLDMEVIFLALDKPEDVKKLLSLEVTGIWVNEAREVPKSIIDACTMRVGRYPSMRDGGPTWSGVFADTNPPEEDHWWPIMAGEVPVPDHIPREQAKMLIKPDDWEFFEQPPGMLEQMDEQGEVKGYVVNPDRENGKYVKPDYYEKIIQGKTKSWIDVYVMNRLGTIMDGKPVYPSFSAEAHVAREPIPVAANVPVYVGIDFGLTPAAVLGQKVRNRYLIQQELVAFDMGVQQFAKMLKELLETKFAEAGEVYIYGDPSGDFRAQTDERTPFDIMRGAGLRAWPAPSNDVGLRTEAVSSLLNTMTEGMASFLVDKENCPMLVKGFEGGYQYKRMQVSGERYADKPDKNMFSHVHDGLQYWALGIGAGRALMNRQTQAKVAVASTNIDVFARGKRSKKRRQGLWARM